MSTLTQAQPGTAVPARLLSVPLAVTFLGEFTSLTSFFGQLPEAKANAWWNLAYDAGYGAGPAVFGLICVRTGYPAAFALTGMLILTALLPAVRDRAAG